MSRKILIVFMIFSVFFVFSCKESEEAAMKRTQEWLQTAELGEFQPAAEDWAQIVEKAKAEGALKVYSTTGRIEDVAESFNAEYGIKIDYVEVEDDEIHEKLLAEQNSGDYSVDLVLSSNPAKLKSDFVDKMKLFKYVPREIEPKLNSYAKDQPLSYYRFGGKAVMYNTAKNSSSPVKTLWDLTTEKWNGNVYMKDPAVSIDDLCFMSAIVQHADAMASVYKEQYGEDLVLDGTENAGYEFLKRFVKNDILFTTSNSKMARAVGSDMQDVPPVGLISTSRLKKIKKEKLSVAIAENVKPVAGFHDKEAILVSRYAANINTAKLLVKWIYGDENGGQGFDPFYRPGAWAARSDVNYKGQKALEDTGFWMQDEEWEVENLEKIREFWSQNM